ncbi:hypothetical protein FRC03_004957 [Tulasnella sp. 419]|nr:hypothetical protein FRC03_004957 [Tulasnella sp. 419]
MTESLLLPSLTIPFVVLGEVVALNMGIDGQSLLRATFVLIRFIIIGVEGSDSEESEELILRVEATRTERGLAALV